MTFFKTTFVAATLMFGSMAHADTDSEATVDTAPRTDGLVVAWCAGGPAKPSYAFAVGNRAQNCAQNIASQSQACRQYVRVGRCLVQNWAVGQVQPFQCQCNAFGRYIGQWY